MGSVKVLTLLSTASDRLSTSESVGLVWLVVFQGPKIILLALGQPSPSADGGRAREAVPLQKHRAGLVVGVVFLGDDIEIVIVVEGHGGVRDVGEEGPVDVCGSVVFVGATLNDVQLRPAFVE